MQWTIKVLRLTIFDYGVCIFGGIGVLLFMGGVRQRAGTRIVYWGLFSIGLCLFSLLMLIEKAFFIRFSRLPEWRTSILYLGFNIIPAISFLIWQAGKTQIQTMPGCC
jgi:hypothetical protein